MLVLLLMIENTYAAVPENVIVPENGWWWNSEFPGGGFNIEDQNGIIFLAMYTYDQSGNPIWYSGGGQLIKNVAHIDLHSFSSGSCPHCPYHPSEVNPVWETIELTFTSPEKGEIKWSGGDTTTIYRFNYGFGFGLDPLKGEWAIISKHPINKDYRSIRVTLNELQCSALSADDPPDTVVLGGTVTDDPANSVKVKELQSDNDFSYLMKTTTSDRLNTFYAFSAEGLNKIAGLEFTTPEENINWSDLNTHGHQFEGYRAQYGEPAFLSGPGRPVCM